ncbi:MAG: hypothetical protein HWE11_09350 [Gammaproteobacteria bacterium]|nr:hypothetical protein [Gammaproteobacteria bacterium]
MRHFLAVVMIWSGYLAAAPAQDSLEYFFDSTLVMDRSVEFDPNVPTPESVLGFQVGQWHVRPEQVAEYMYALAATSKRVWVEEMGRSYEQRPLLLVSFSNQSNIQNLATIKQSRQEFISKNAQSPNIVWMGYSVHGNEASGVNAAVLLAYYLAAAQGEQVEKLLANSVILMEPMINPDGIARFAHWVNAHKSQQLIADPMDIEHNETWPQGRTNHYWFDLNRDWLLVQHPESQARLAAFHQWKPQVVTDFHEMGTNSTYFFQPGVPSRNNPKTPQENFTLTAKIAEFHARALDAIGSRYYSKEDFDDFYYGKGSTYPDINGAVGILFEQASARGHLQNSVNGPLSFPFAIRNHLATSFSTLKAVMQEGKALRSYQSKFYQGVEKLASDHKVKAYLFDADGDNRRLNEFLKILDLHQVRYFQLARDVEVNKRSYYKNEAYLVPMAQPQFRLIRSIFETETSFKDSTFYDVSSWTLALSFNLDFSALDSSDYSSRLRGKIGKRTQNKEKFSLDDKAVALVFDWRDFNTAVLTSRLLKVNAGLKVVTKRSQFNSSNGPQWVAAGSIVLPLNEQPMTREELTYWLDDNLGELPVKHFQLTSGLAIDGADLGSPTVKTIVTPKPLLIVGSGVNSYEAGEVWHLLDTRLEWPLVKVTAAQLESLDLSAYTHLIMVSGRYRFSDDVNKKIERWVHQGGQVVASRTAGQWLSTQMWSPLEKPLTEEPAKESLTYSERDQFHAEKVIGGAIFQAEVDLSHPLAFGLERSRVPFFRRGTDHYQVAEDERFAVVARYSDAPLMSGYASAENQQQLANTPVLVATRRGQGGVIYFADNMNFRAFWWGTSKLFINSLYFPYSYWSSSNE